MMVAIEKDAQLAEFYELLEEQKKSGLLVKDFCKEKNMSIGKWNYCKLLIKKANTKRFMPNLSPVKVVKKETSDNSPIKLALPNGFQLTLPPDLDPKRIKQLIEVLLSC